MRLLVFGFGNKLGQAAYHTFQVLWGSCKSNIFAWKMFHNFWETNTHLLQNFWKKKSDLGNPKVGSQIIQISTTPLKTNIYHINIPWKKQLWGSRLFVLTKERRAPLDSRSTPYEP